MKRGKIHFLKVSIWIVGIVVLAMLIFWLPWLAREAGEMHPEYAYLRFPVLIGLYMTAIPFYFALYQALKLIHYIEREHAFSELAVRSLGHIKSSAMAIVILYVLGIGLLVLLGALHPGIAIIGVVIMFATLVISFFTDVLQELLRAALVCKSENDLTV